MSLSADETKRVQYFARAELDYEKQVAAVMREALDKIRVDMAKIYDKYAVDGILTKAQMTQYNRLASLEKSVIATMKESEKKAIKIIDKMRPEEYGEAFFRTAWAIDNNTSVELTFGALNKKAITANLDNVFYTNAKSVILSSNAAQFSNAINQGLALGQSYTDMMRDLKKAVNLKNLQIMRVLRTELHTAQEAGTAQGYREAIDQGIDGKVVWISTLDDRTRDTHQQMDGVYKDDDGMFRGAVGETPYPGWEGLPASERINCRCSERFELAGLEPTIRRSKDDGLLPYQTYDDWIDGKDMFK